MKYLERFDFHPDARPRCPACGAVELTGLREVAVPPRRRGQYPGVSVRAEPCGCEVTEHAARLQADAILAEHDLAERAAAASCRGGSRRHVFPVLQVALALTGLRDVPELAVCSRCGATVDVTDLVRGQEARRASA